MPLYTVGTRVGYVLDMEEECDSGGPREPYYGVVSALTIDEPTKLVITWDESYAQQYYPPLVDLEDVLPEEDVKEKYTRLEEEFNEIVDALTTKMEEAGKFIKEAAKLAKEHGFELNEMSDVYYPLYNAMDKAGWNTSSFSC
jgi:hypothetical protein